MKRLLTCWVFGLAGLGSVSAEETRRPGADFMGPSTQAMQNDDTQNPAMLWVKDGEALWQARAGKNQQSCASCHGEASTSMRGVATRYPAFDTRSGGPINLSQRINQSRQQHQQAPPFALESADLLSLESYIAYQSRGMPIKPVTDPRLAEALARGAQSYLQRIGQLDLSCAQCHDSNAGQSLGSALIPQAHPDGYPIYRLEWQNMGSLQRRLRNCMSGMRAQPHAYGAPELVALELFLANRAQGMQLAAPGVRP